MMFESDIAKYLNKFEDSSIIMQVFRRSHHTKNFRYYYTKWLVYTALCIFLLMLAPPITYSIEETAKLSGKILDSRGDPIPSVRVQLPESKKQAFSDIHGNYLFEGISSVSHIIKVSRIGFRSFDTTIMIINKKNNILDIKLIESDIITDEVVVTGTRSYKNIETLPMPIDVITKSEIHNDGFTSLDEILSQQLGLPLVDDHGRGVQMQGLNSDFSLILINGEPVSGRTGGILDISRFNVSNVNRVEVVKGPSSSLYGSNALAGVINLITEKPNKPLSVSMSGKYANYNSVDLNAELRGAAFDKKFGYNLFVNRFNTDGYSQDPSAIFKTIPENTKYTLNGELYYDLGQIASLKLGSRYMQESDANRFFITDYINNNPDSAVTFPVREIVDNNEYNASFNIKHESSNRYSLEARFYGTGYSTETCNLVDSSGALRDSYKFEQKTGKAEIQSTALLGSHQIVGGFGAIYDNVNGPRIASGSQSQTQFYGYLQEDWQALGSLDFIASLRYDANSNYPSNFSPKVAASWRPITDLVIRGSVGTGFKAPDFEQLYLDWTNSLEGYTVLGTKYVKEGLAKMQSQGLIRQILIDPSSLQALKPEHSLAFDFGFTYNFEEFLDCKLNLFRNQISGLINFLPIALKSNGLRLHTYTNVDEVYTQGVEANVKLGFLSNFSLELYYQYLETADIKVQDSIRQGRMWKRDPVTNQDRKVQLSEYGGLFNRSPHTANIKLLYNNNELGIYASLRGLLRSRYGYADQNGNFILDADNEYHPGYALWYLTASKDLFKYFTIQAGMDNILDKTGKNIQFATSGRTYWVNLIFNYIID
ncbi:MAG: outer rane receptor for ferrienterochelin and colicin [Bacteroidota bacterium]|nr:outer rane receptor for ferrienterochelin and colicin [Bacteroidota bacterium]